MITPLITSEMRMGERTRHEHYYRESFMVNDRLLGYLIEHDRRSRIQLVFLGEPLSTDPNLTYEEGVEALQDIATDYLLSCVSFREEPDHGPEEEDLEGMEEDQVS